MNDTLVEFRDVSKSYGTNQVLSGIDLEIRAGEFLTLLGPSGCGKTTLLRLLAGFDQLTSGEILLQGENIALVPAEKRPVNTVFQSYTLFPHMTVYENVAFGPRLKKIAGEDLRQRVMQALATVKLEDFAERKPAQLSGGQQQRVAIARALINKPKVLLLDEPLSALDYKLRKSMQIELKQLQRSLGITFLFVTHDQEEALSMSDRVAVMNEGRIEQLDTPKIIYEEPSSLMVARFVGETNLFRTRVVSRNDKTFVAELEGRQMTFPLPKNFEMQEWVTILLRPEDLRVWSLAEVEEKPERGKDAFHASVEEVIYKGSTVDLLVRMESGRQVSAAAFFDDEDPQLNYRRGEQVFFSWTQGWEAILPAEQGDVESISQ